MKYDICECNMTGAGTVYQWN